MVVRTIVQGNRKDGKANWWGALILVLLWIYARFSHMFPQKVPPTEGVYGPPPPPPIPISMKWAGAKCTKNTHTCALHISQSSGKLPLHGLTKITRLYIDRDSAKMEILIANQLAVLSWFNEDSEEYKFIKKALEDVDEVDRIDVLASDEVANHTETPDVGPSTSSAASAHTCRQHAPTPHLATETPDPPLSTPYDIIRPFMPPIPPIDTESPLWFTHAEFESSLHTTTVDHNSPITPSCSSPQTIIPIPSL